MDLNRTPAPSIELPEGAAIELVTPHDEVYRVSMNVDNSEGSSLYITKMSIVDGVYLPIHTGYPRPNQLELF